jgi:hypothetical protein
MILATIEQFPHRSNGIFASLKAKPVYYAINTLKLRAVRRKQQRRWTTKNFQIAILPRKHHPMKLIINLTTTV